MAPFKRSPAKPFSVLPHHLEEIACRCPHFGERLRTYPTREPPAANRRCRINQTWSEKRHEEFRAIRLPMTGKGSIHEHGSHGGEIAGNLGAKFSGNAVNRAFNALASGQFLEACPEILVGGADDLVACEIADNGFLLAPPDNVDCLIDTAAPVRSTPPILHRDAGHALACLTGPIPSSFDLKPLIGIYPFPLSRMRIRNRLSVYASSVSIRRP
jgi:hypothetical protein